MLKKESETNVEKKAPTKTKKNYKEKKMEQFLEIIMEHGGTLIIGILVVLCNIIGKPKTAEKIKKATEKKIEKTHKKSIKLVHALQEANKKEEELKKELEENATK